MVLPVFGRMQSCFGGSSCKGGQNQCKDSKEVSAGGKKEGTPSRPPMKPNLSVKSINVPSKNPFDKELLIVYNKACYSEEEDQAEKISC